LGTLNYFSNYDEAKDFNSRIRKFVESNGFRSCRCTFFCPYSGITVGKYNYKVIKQRIFRIYRGTFDGLRLHQISDVHSGSFDNPDKYNTIDLINAQNSDLILFTGDIVNTRRNASLDRNVQSIASTENFLY
jgi:hypothetical protein